MRPLQASSPSPYRPRNIGHHTSALREIISSPFVPVCSELRQVAPCSSIRSRRSALARFAVFAIGAALAAQLPIVCPRPGRRVAFGAIELAAERHHVICFVGFARFVCATVERPGADESFFNRPITVRPPISLATATVIRDFQICNSESIFPVFAICPIEPSSSRYAGQSVAAIAAWPSFFAGGSRRAWRSRYAIIAAIALLAARFHAQLFGILNQPC